MDISDKELRALADRLAVDDGAHDLADGIAITLAAVRNAAREQCLAVCAGTAKDAQEIVDEMRSRGIAPAAQIDEDELHEHGVNVANAISARIRALKWRP